MSKPKTSIGPTRGLTPLVRLKTQKRRETQAALTEITSSARAHRNDLTPDLPTQQVPIESVRPASRRVRRSEKKQAARLDASIRKFGQVLPVLINADRSIVHGHGIYDALKRAGAEHVTVTRIAHLSAAELRLLAIALNRLGETGAWDEEALQIEFIELIELGEDPVVTGFEVAEIDGLLLADEIEDTDEEDGELIVPAAATSRLGDLWRLGAHLLLQGDALKAESYSCLMVEGETAQLVLSDPPYNVPNLGHVTSSRDHREFAMAHGELSRAEFSAFLITFLAEASERVADGGLLMVFMDWRSIELLLAAGRELELALLNVIAWVKTNGGQGSLWRSQHEFVAVFKKGRALHRNNIALGRWGRWRSNVWTYPGGSTLGCDARDGLEHHPTPKPRALVEDALLDVTDLGDIVLDPFAGSGTSMIAAEGARRVCRAIEIDGIYCDVSILRWQALTGEQAVLTATGETFGEVAHRRDAEQKGRASDDMRLKRGVSA